MRRISIDFPLIAPVARCMYGGMPWSVSRPVPVARACHGNQRHRDLGGTRCRYAHPGIAAYWVFNGGRR